MSMNILGIVNKSSGSGLIRLLPLLFIIFLPLYAWSNDPVKPADSTIKTIYIVPSSHYDFGFVDPPDVVRERAARHIDEVIRIAESDPNFRWSIESVWQVNEWLKRARTPTSVLPKDQAKIDRLMRLIKSGQIALSTSWGSMHTDFMGEEELNRICYGYTDLKRTYGINSEMAMMDDVPGHPTSVPSVLAGSGTKYLLAGANVFINNATSLAPGKVPFYWQSPDGSKVLTWISQSPRGGYTEALTDYYLDPFTIDPYTGKTEYEMFNPKSPKKSALQIMEEGVAELQKRYSQAGYKYDAVLAMDLHDFLEPTNVSNLERAVKLWNDNHDSPKLKIATPPEFFHYIEDKYGSQIPTYRGEWSGLWSESKTQSPQFSAEARYAHDHTPAAESLWSYIAMTRSIPFPVGNSTSLYDLMFTYDEHSGAGNTGWPQLNESKKLVEQNREYSGFLKTARQQVDDLFQKGIEILAEPTAGEPAVPLPNGNTWPLMVYNPLSWLRDDVVTVGAPDEGLKITGVRDNATGRPVAFDVDDKGQAIFIATGVPAFGYTTYRIETGPGKAVSTLRPVPRSTVTENKHFRVRLSPTGDIESIVALASGREMVNGKGELPFNRLLRVHGQEPEDIAYPLAPVVTVKRGVGMNIITVARPRSGFPETIITLYDGLDRLDLHNELDGDKLPFASGKSWNDSYYFAFPFALNPKGLTVLRGGQKWFDRFPEDYLPGARRDSVTTQHLIGMADNEGSVWLAHRQAFHFLYPGYVKARPSPKGAPAEFPAMFTGTWPLKEATLYSRAIRIGNQADTHDIGVMNVDTVEPGFGMVYDFDYSLNASSGKFDDVAAWRFGSTFNVPLIAQFVTVFPKTATEGFFSVDQPNVEIVAIKPLADTTVTGEVSASPLDPKQTRVFIVRLHEFAGRTATVQLKLPVAAAKAQLLNLTEDRALQELSAGTSVSVTLKPFETATVRIDLAAPEARK
jgi:hypothetical protein